MPDPKPRPNHREYIKALRRMTPEQRLMKAIELSELTREMFRQGLRKRFPLLSDEDFHKLYLEHWLREIGSEELWKRLQNEAEVIEPQ